MGTGETVQVCGKDIVEYAQTTPDQIFVDPGWSGAIRGGRSTSVFWCDRSFNVTSLNVDVENVYHLPSLGHHAL